MIHTLALLALAQFAPQPTARAIQQVGSDWVVSLSFPYTAPPDDPEALHLIAPSDLTARITAHALSNSRAATPDRPAVHGHPRPAAHAIDGAARSSVAALVDDGQDARRCRERAVLTLWAAAPGKAPDPPGDEAAPQAVALGDGATLNVRIVLRHEHDGNDGLDPLLGRREVTLRIGDWTYRDTLDLSREQFVNMPDPAWRPMEAVPEERRDTGMFFSAPYSLILDAESSGNQYYRFPERKVRGGVRMRLKFRFMIASGCEGEVKVRIAQYRESPNAWKVLSDGGFERELPKPVDGKPSKNGTPGERAAMRWRVFEEVFTTQPEANTLAADFRIANAEAGLVWIDDFTLDYAGGVPATAP